MSVREMMGRLNCSTVRFDIGRGGKPELTAQDIAGALGMVREDLPREIFCHVWWPDGAKLSTRDIDTQMLRAQVDEYAKRRQALEAAELAKLIAEDGYCSKSQAQHAVAEARAEQWPHWTRESKPIYANVRVMTFEELRAGGLCERCKGRGFIIKQTTDGEKREDCRSCDGSGRVTWTDTERAKRLDMSYHHYRRHWSEAYSWLYNLLVCAEARGARLVSAALFGKGD